MLGRDALDLAGLPADEHAAAAAHAAAHRAFSPGLRLERDGLVPITQALIGLLEDARCEHLACRGLPGLRRLWQPRHQATPDDGDGLEALLARLARALADPRYEDPHPWVAKGRALFFDDERGEVLAVRQAADLRRVASRLGHDLGQMRLGFSARTYRPQPAYRDDNRWLWVDAVRPEDQRQPEAGPEAVDPPEALQATDPSVTEHHLPEWDRLIGVMRPRWCRVLDTPSRLARRGTAPAVNRVAARQLARLAQAPRGLRAGGGACDWGDELDLDALLDSVLRRRAGERFSPRPYRMPSAQAHPGATLLLLDVSASSDDRLDGGEASPRGLEFAREVAATLAGALRAGGEAVAVAAFRSDGRQRVELLRLLDFDEAWSPDAACRLGGLRAAGSTRLGAALRHACATLAARPEPRRRLLVLGDGDPYDIDLHDPRYLLEDARQAIAEARRRGVQVLGLGLGQAAAARRAQLFGRRSTRTLRPGGGWAAQVAALCG
jgi:hypothetical protein